MMIIRLFCPTCTLRAAETMRGEKLAQVDIEVPTPITELSDNGEYPVRCESGHVSKVFLDNIKVELLFEMGLNALVDGYYREAVSSFAAALERFHEFFWHVAVHHFEVPVVQAEETWKLVAKLSERQAGMFAAARLTLTKEEPALLSNADVKFRNDVIHAGKVPQKADAISFGNKVMNLINQDLDHLRRLAPNSLSAVYKRFSPAPDMDTKAGSATVAEGEAHQGNVNHLCAIDAKSVARSEKSLLDRVENHFQRIVRDRQPHRMQLFTDESVAKEAMKKEAANKDAEFKGPLAIPFLGSHCALLPAPEGWVVDQRQNGPYLASLYPAHTTQEQAIANREWMYVTFSRKDKKLPDLDALLKMQDDRIRARFKDPKITYQSTIDRTDCKTKLRINRIAEYEGVVDCTLFLDFPEIIFFISLLSPQERFEENFKKLEWVGKNVRKGEVSIQRK